MNNAQAPEVFPRTPLIASDGPRCREILPRAPGGSVQPPGWTEPVLFEWQLTGERWTDQHPHTEYNFVIEGRLFVESGGVTVEARAGDVVRVPAGAVGRYWAPEYARLLAIYGPSDGAPSRRLGYERLTDQR